MAGQTYTLRISLPSAVNRAPVFSGDSTTREVAENTATEQNIGAAVTATDADDDNLTYSLSGTDVAAFGIVAASGQLQTKAALDYETRSSYEVTVTATDPSSATDSITVTISVTNVEEAGAVNFDSTSPALGIELTATLSDPDGGETGITWQWSSSATSNGDFTAISGATNAAYTPASTDVGNYLRATASYEDALGTGKTASAVTANAVALTGPNTPPTIDNIPPESEILTALTVEEHSTAVIYTFTATDADGDTITWRLEGPDALLFAINAAGELTAASDSALNYDSGITRYDLAVVADDGKDAVSELIRVNVTETAALEVPLAPDAPTVTTESSTSLTVLWSPPDNAGPPITGYLLRGRMVDTTDDDTEWTIAASTYGLFTSFSAQGLAVDTEYEVQVQASNGDGAGEWSASGTGSTAAASADNTAPVIDGEATRAFELAENSAAPTNVGSPFTATDAEGDPIIWSLEGADAAGVHHHPERAIGGPVRHAVRLRVGEEELQLHGEGQRRDGSAHGGGECDAHR